MKKVLLGIGIFLAAIVLAAFGLLLWLSAAEFRPAPQEDAAFLTVDNFAPEASLGDFTVLTWNTGYAGLGAGSDFFMDGGKMVNPPSGEAAAENLAGIRDFLLSQDADAYFLQEVDIDSQRSGGVNQLFAYQEALGCSAAFAYNYKCPFVPFPLPPIGRVESGIATLTQPLTRTDSQRIRLPCPFSWPIRTANLKRCLLVTHIPLKDTDRELTLVNLHLEAYDDGTGKAAQTQALMELLTQEYAKGNYVIAGGDFNQTFPGALEAYPILDENLWTPGLLEDNILPEGWQFVYDSSVPTCRLLDKPFDVEREHQFYVIDGFLVSPNVEVASVETLNENFTFTDHNPVRLRVRLN